MSVNGIDGLKMQGIIVFASVMATLGLQILLESVREIISKASYLYVVCFFMSLASKFKYRAWDRRVYRAVRMS